MIVTSSLNIAAVYIFTVINDKKDKLNQLNPHHKVSFNFNSQPPPPPHQQLFISIQLPYISNGYDSQTGLFSKLPHKCKHYMNKCVHHSLEKMLFSRSSRFGRVSYCLQSRQHLPLSTLQSKSRAVHFRAVCQVVTASGSISWLRISTHTHPRPMSPQLTLIV